jgi:hypothetical protein
MQRISRRVKGSSIEDLKLRRKEGAGNSLSKMRTDKPLEIH